MIYNVKLVKDKNVKIWVGVVALAFRYFSNMILKYIYILIARNIKSLKITKSSFFPVLLGKLLNIGAFIVNVD